MRGEPQEDYAPIVPQSMDDMLRFGRDLARSMADSFRQDRQLEYSRSSSDIHIDYSPRNLVRGRPALKDAPPDSGKGFMPLMDMPAKESPAKSSPDHPSFPHGLPHPDALTAKAEVAPPDALTEKGRGCD